MHLSSLSLLLLPLALATGEQSRCPMKGKAKGKCPHGHDHNKEEPTAMPVLAATADLPIKTDSTAKDISKLNPKQCSQLTAELVSSTLKSEACAGFKPACLKAFNVTNLCPSCVNALKGETLRALDGKTVKELVSSEVQHLGLSTAAFTELVEKIEEPPALFVAYVVRDAELMATVLNTEKLAVIKPYLKMNTLPKLHASLFRRFSTKVVAALPDDAFKQVQAQQVALIPPASFAALTPAHLENMRPEALKQCTRAQLSHLTEATMAKLSPAQVRSLLTPGEEVPKVASKEDEVRAMEVLERRSYLLNHPCQVLVARKEQLTAEAQKACDEHCKSIMTANLNGSSGLMTTGAALLLAAIAPLLI